MAGLEPHPRDTRAIYDRQAEAYDAGRSRTLFEAGWLTRFAQRLPTGGHVLDLGCGTGDPIARWFIERHFGLTGVDFAPAMLDIARRRWPEGDWRQADMRDFDLADRFDGIIAWDSLFHLMASEQLNALSRMARHLKPGGQLLLTVGPGPGEAVGHVGGEPVYHASLSLATYATCLEDSGMTLTDFLSEDPDAARHTVLMARKT